MIPRTDPETIRAQAAASRDLLTHPGFTNAVMALRKQWFGELMNDGLNDPPKVLELVAKLRALEAIPSMLNHFVISESMEKGRSNGRGH